jgi:hypothetical protein
MAIARRSVRHDQQRSSRLRCRQHRAAPAPLVQIIAQNAPASDRPVNRWRPPRLDVSRGRKRPTCLHPVDKRCSGLNMTLVTHLTLTAHDPSPISRQPALLTPARMSASGRQSRGPTSGRGRITAEPTPPMRHDPGSCFGQRNAHIEGSTADWPPLPSAPPGEIPH